MQAGRSDLELYPRHGPAVPLRSYYEAAKEIAPERLGKRTGTVLARIDAQANRQAQGRGPIAAPGQVPRSGSPGPGEILRKGVTEGRWPEKPPSGKPAREAETERVAVPEPVSDTAGTMDRSRSGVSTLGLAITPQLKKGEWIDIRGRQVTTFN